VRTKGIVVAIDGPAGAGKSTTAKAVATRLGYLYLDTGAMYRAVALDTLRAGIDPDDAESVGRRAVRAKIEQVASDGGTRTLIDGEDISDDIRSQEVSDAASRVAVHPQVREVLVALQRSIGEDGGIVLEGRDTTTAIFPDAELKVFLDASVEERALRRHREPTGSGDVGGLDGLRREIQERDDRDRQTQSRHGPWPSPQAIRVDTTGLTIEEQVDLIAGLARERGAEGVA
jgi:cytidylate kinase